MNVARKPLACRMRTMASSKLVVVLEGKTWGRYLCSWHPYIVIHKPHYK